MLNDTFNSSRVTIRQKHHDSSVTKEKVAKSLLLLLMQKNRFLGKTPISTFSKLGIITPMDLLFMERIEGRQAQRPRMQKQKHDVLGSQG
ncbi:MAG: hypothetical protein EA373_13335 [Oceanospirillales bacterium]|nr:MAG: hypothetical protein EA373_13335 [Oceanospirillales bacterium]